MAEPPNKPHTPVGYVDRRGHWRYVCAKDGEVWPCEVERADARVPVRGKP